MTLIRPYSQTLPLPMYSFMHSLYYLFVYLLTYLFIEEMKARFMVWGVGRGRLKPLNPYSMMIASLPV